MMQIPAPLPAPQMISPPSQPEVRIADHLAGAVSVRWSAIGFPAAAYVVELRHGSTSTSSRYVCQAPADGAGSLELCIQGLQPGHSYTACIRSVAQDGFESAPSPWSAWVTLPVMLQPCSPMVCGSISTSVPQMPSPPVQQQPPSPYSILFDDLSVENPGKNQFGMVKACPAPQITGHEEALFLD